MFTAHSLPLNATSSAKIFPKLNIKRRTKITPKITTKPTVRPTALIEVYINHHGS